MKPYFLITITMILFSCSANKHVSELFSRSKSLENKTFHYQDLDGLPKPLQGYFRYALEDGQSCLSQLRLKHTGRFKTGVEKDWVDIKGEQYFTAQPPGFVWLGKTKAFKARDSYVTNNGNLSVYLFGSLRIVNSKGRTVDQAELLRWLGESVWMPTNLLPNEHISWSGIDENTAKITFDWNGHSVYYIVHFNEKNQVIKIETERYMEENRLEKWEGRLGDYRQVNGIRVPGSIEASWLLKEGKHTYADFRVEIFEYNIPKCFE